MYKKEGEYDTSICAVVPTDAYKAVALFKLYNPTEEGGHHGENSL